MKNPTSSVIALGSKIFKSSLFRAAGTYGFFSLLNKVIPFLLLPVMTRYLTPRDYGYTAVFSVMVALITPFIGFNTPGAYVRAYYAQGRFEMPRYLGTVFCFVVVSGIGTSCLLYPFRELIGQTFSFPVAWLWSVPVVATAASFVLLTLSSWRVRELPWPYGLFQNSQTLAGVTGAILFVVVLGMAWQGRILSQVIVTSLFAFLGICFIVKNKWITLSFDSKYLRHALCFGIPLIPHSLSGILNTSIDRVFITHMVGMADTGLYTVGYQIGMIINLIATAFNQAYVPWLYRKLNEDSCEIKRKIVKMTYVYFGAILLGTLFFSFTAPYLMRLMLGAEFKESSRYILWIALGYAFNGMYFMVVSYIFYAEKTAFLALATVTGALINIVLNYFLIKSNGAIGAAQATTLTYFFIFLMVWFLSTRMYSMPWFDFWKKDRDNL